MSAPIPTSTQTSTIRNDLRLKRKKLKEDSEGMTNILFNNVSNLVVINLTRKFKNELNLQGTNNTQIKELIKTKIKEKKNELERKTSKDLVIVLRGSYLKSNTSQSTPGTTGTTSAPKKKYFLAFQRKNRVVIKESDKPFKFKSDSKVTTVVSSPNSQSVSTRQTNQTNQRNTEFNTRLNSLTFQPLELGIENFTGVNCYMNAMLHSLFPIFYYKGEKPYIKNLIKESKKDSVKLSELLINLLTGRAVNQENIVGVMQNVHNPGGTQLLNSSGRPIQCDTAEFLNGFFQKYNNLFNYIKNKIKFKVVELFFYTDTLNINKELLNTNRTQYFKIQTGGSKLKVVSYKRKIKIGGANELYNWFKSKDFNSKLKFVFFILSEAIVKYKNNLTEQITMDPINFFKVVICLLINQNIEDLMKYNFSPANQTEYLKLQKKFCEEIEIQKNFKIKVNGVEKTSGLNIIFQNLYTYIKNVIADMLSFSSNNLNRFNFDSLISEDLKNFLTQWNSVNSSSNLIKNNYLINKRDLSILIMLPNIKTADLEIVKKWYNKLDENIKNQITNASELKRIFESQNRNYIIIDYQKDKIFEGILAYEYVCRLEIKNNINSLNRIISDNYGYPYMVTSPSNKMINIQPPNIKQPTPQYLKKNYFLETSEFLLIFFGLSTYSTTSGAQAIMTKQTNFQLNNKLDDVIEIPIYNLNTKNINNVEYVFNDIIFHIGSSLNSGHYACLSKRENKWYIFNDLERKELTTQEFQNLNLKNFKDIDASKYNNSNPYFVVLRKKTN